MIIFVFVMCLCASVFTALGIYAAKRKDPIWFWSGTTVKAEELSDVTAYNRENGIMWCAYSLFFWLAAILALFDLMPAAGILVFIGGFGGVFLVPVYQRIYKKYAKK